MAIFIFRDKPEDFEDSKTFVHIFVDNTLSRLEEMEDSSIDCWITSPPYFNKMDYGVGVQIGLEETVSEYAEKIALVAEQMLRCSTDMATFFLVVGTSWNNSGGTGGDYQDESSNYKVTVCHGAHVVGCPKKADLMIPERLRAEIAGVGWLPRCKIIWDKNDPRRGAKDRPSYSFEEILVFSKNPKHYWDREAVLQPYSDKSLSQLGSEYTGTATRDYKGTGQEDPSESKRRMISKMQTRPGALLRSVWAIPSGSQPRVDTEEFGTVTGMASFPVTLSDICVNLGSKPLGVVCDPFSGMGTTGVSALKYGRNYYGIELNRKYAQASFDRLSLDKPKRATIKMSQKCRERE